MKKYQNFYLKIFISLAVNFSIYLNRPVFVMSCRTVLGMAAGDVHIR